ncbi:MAG: HypC/HybG/HupF family hydrogenase formation chaperone [Nanoarchaeota archaeon]|nr:HypC/HybG/HupF family hydrogenase formation chaperone [Nanoarchaeota archaeon]
MCLAVPGKIISIDGSKAIVDFGGIRRKADITFLEEPKIGEYVIVHVGFAIQKVEEEVAKNTYNLLAEMEDE